MLEKTKTNIIVDKIVTEISDVINDDPTLTDHEIRAILLRIRNECTSQPNDWR